MISSANVTVATATTGNQCSTPTQKVTISTVDNGATLGFNPNSINVNKGACVAVTLVNPSNHTHDFDIAASENAGMTTVHVPFPTDGSNVTTNVQFPNKDMKVIFYCDISGHRAAGMVGTFIVGTGKSGGFLPGFELPMTIIAFLSMVAVVPLVRKYKK